MSRRESRHGSGQAETPQDTLGSRQPAARLLVRGDRLLQALPVLLRVDARHDVHGLLGGAFDDLVGILPFNELASPTPRAVTSGTVTVDVVTPPES